MNAFQELIREASSSISRAFRRAVMEFTAHVSKRMEADNLRHQDLAKRLNVSRSYVSRLLSGKTNYTLETMVKVAHELGCDLTLDFEDRSEQVGASKFHVVATSQGSTVVSSSKTQSNQQLWQCHSRTEPLDKRRGSSLVAFAQLPSKVTGEELAFAQN